MTTIDLSIVIPCLNESEALPPLLQDLKNQEGLNLQILVCDGGSTDGSRALAKEFGVEVLDCPRGRATQMNFGSKQAQSDNLLFLHADSRMNDPQLLEKALRSFLKRTELSLKVAGHFALKFIHESEDNNWAFRWLEEKTATNRLHSINGDQGLLIKKLYFEDLGEFDDSMNFLEDQKIAAKIFQGGEWILLPGELWTSGRRFETEGFHRRYILMSLIMGLYWTKTYAFFDRARDIYKNQDDTSKLMLGPFVRAIWDMHRYDLGFKESLKAWFRVGHYVRTNSWQLFFFFDVAFRKILGPSRYPFTWFHDKIFWPLTNNKICDFINSIICIIWFAGILGPYFLITESFMASSRKSRLKI